MQDDFYTRNDMIQEVASRAIWSNKVTGRSVRLLHYFHDKTARKLDVIFASDGAVSCANMNYWEFQQQYVKVN